MKAVVKLLVWWIKPRGPLSNILSGKCKKNNECGCQTSHMRKAKKIKRVAVKDKKNVKKIMNAVVKPLISGKRRKSRGRSSNITYKKM